MTQPASNTATTPDWAELGAVLVIIPTYNEAENIGPIVARLRAAVPDADVLIVDDNSPDGTGQVADDLARRTPRVKVIHRPGKLGLGTAYVEAFRHALAGGYDAAFSMDGDFSHDPAYLPLMAETAQRADLVIGSRYMNGISVVNWDLKRLILSQLANSYARLVTGMPFHDCTSGFQCLTRRALEALPLDRIHSSGYSFLIELKYRIVHAGLTGVEVPIVFTDRRLGVSKISQGEIVRSMITGSPCPIDPAPFRPTRF